LSRKTSNDRQTTPTKRALYTPEPLQGRVIARHFAGESLRQIATEEGIARDTAGRILSQPEVVEMMARYQSNLLAMVPLALGVYAEALNSDDLRLALVPATKILDFFYKGGIEQSIEMVNRASPVAEQPDRKLLILGEMIEATLEKKQRWGVDSPELDRLESEVNARMETRADGGT
jgi:hypothetical protein